MVTNRSPALEVYFVIRNVILSLWYQDCTRPVTMEMCLGVLSLRGVVRVWSANQLPRILHFMSRRGYVNQGMISTDNTPHPLADLQPLKNKVQRHTIHTHTITYTHTTIHTIYTIYTHTIHTHTITYTHNIHVYTHYTHYTL